MAKFWLVRSHQNSCQERHLPYMTAGMSSIPPTGLTPLTHPMDEASPNSLKILTPEPNLMNFTTVKYYLGK